MIKKIAVFASGSGSNAENLIRFFKNTSKIRVEVVISNNLKAGVFERAHKLNIPCQYFSKTDFQSGSVTRFLIDKQIDFIVLAGFLLLVPENIISAYKNKIINLHPALLPAHGGKGFYGEKVHESVIASGSQISGITIHHVNDKFDEGEIIFQAACHVAKNETPVSLAAKIHELEYRYLPQVVAKIV